MSDRLTTGTIDLRIEQIAAQYGISRSALTLSESEDWMMNEVVYRLVRKVVTLPGDEQIKVPASWWDALKEAEVRRSPIMRWWVRRSPVRYRIWRALEVLPRFPELDKYRDNIRLATLVRDYDPADLDA